ncbi:MAG TPA: zinc-dependent alcohol dehydrogenase family protein [Brevibacillus sp.]|nr:zinc-dependent alcohol dehydrogenase family protein [Brevibacillus sp.]
MLEPICIQFHEFGDARKVLQVTRRPIEKPARGELLVQMIHRPINPSDLLPIRGAYAHRIPLPSIPGYEGVGVVVEVGPSVSSQWIGRRVLPLRGEGTWQEFVKTSAELAVPVPDFLEDYIAAQLYINPLTAWLLSTEVLALQPDDVLLVNAGGSAIGRIFAQLARILGFKLVALTRNDRYTEELLQLGAAHVINTAEMPGRSIVMDMTHGKGAKAAIDSIGGQDGSELASMVQPGGSVVTIGLLSGQPVNWAEVTRNTGVQVKLFHLRHWNEQASVQKWQDTFQILMELVREQRLAFRTPSAYFDLNQVGEAVQVAESSGRNTGKVFLSS